MSSNTFSGTMSASKPPPYIMSFRRYHRDIRLVSNCIKVYVYFGNLTSGINLNFLLKGARVDDLGKVKINLLLFLTEGSVKNIVPSRSYWMFQSWNYRTNYSTHANFKHDFPKIEIFRISKSISSCKFWNRPFWSLTIFKN